MSTIMGPFGLYATGHKFDPNETMVTWIKSWEKVATSNSNTIELKMWLPRAIWLDWSDPKTWQTRLFDPSIWLPVALSPPEERERVKTIMTIAGNYIAGDMIGGDMIRDISNSDIINKSSVKNSFMANKAQIKSD